MPYSYTFYILLRSYSDTTLHTNVYAHILSKYVYILLRPYMYDTCQHTFTLISETHLNSYAKNLYLFTHFCTHIQLIHIYTLLFPCTTCMYVYIHLQSYTSISLYSCTPIYLYMFTLFLRPYTHYICLYTSRMYNHVYLLVHIFINLYVPL
jgi:hypothetical protein